MRMLIFLCVNFVCLHMGSINDLLQDILIMSLILMFIKFLKSTLMHSLPLKKGFFETWSLKWELLKNIAITQFIINITHNQGKGSGLMLLRYAFNIHS